jgi:hypothetical protein
MLSVIMTIFIRGGIGGKQGRFHGPASLGTCSGLAQNFFFLFGKKKTEKNIGKRAKWANQ